MPIRVGRGKASIIIEGPLADGIQDDILGALGPIGDRMMQLAGDVADRARAQWPVWTGKSRDGIATRLQIEPDNLVVRAEVYTVDYAKYILSTKVETKRKATRLRSPFVQLVRAPLRLAQAELKAEAVPLLEAHLQRLLEG